MEQYKVKVWITDKATGYRTQVIEDVTLPTNSKSAHKRAGKVILNKYKDSKPELVTITYC